MLLGEPTPFRLPTRGPGKRGVARLRTPWLELYARPVLAVTEVRVRPLNLSLAAGLAHSLWAQTTLITLGVGLFLFVLQPRIGIRDGDAYAYIVCAYSIASGQGFRELAHGAPLNH